MEILIIDPSELFIERLTELILESNSYDSIYAAASLQQAEKRLNEVVPDIVLADMSILISDGFAFLRQIKEYSADAVVVVLFTIANEYHLGQCRKYGASHLYDKYVDFDKIPAAINALRPEREYRTGILKSK
jgi:DNA-binding NarL/FixJ family response regulator